MANTFAYALMNLKKDDNLSSEIAAIMFEMNSKMLNLMAETERKRMLLEAELEEKREKQLAK